jgi:hypothetical protein
MDLNVQVVPGSTILLDMDAELRRVTQLAQIASSFPGVANLPELWKEIVRKSGFANDTERFALGSMPMPATTALEPSMTETGGIPGLPPIPGTPSPTPMMMGSNPAMEQGL